jgi:transcriptional regulator with XRE-family HTH domain
MLSGNLIKEARQRSRLSQRQLARAAGTSQSIVARYETGDVLPSLAQLQRLLEAAGFELKVELREIESGLDSEQLRNNLRLTPAERLLQAVTAARWVSRNQGRATKATAS